MKEQFEIYHLKSELLNRMANNSTIDVPVHLISTQENAIEQYRNLRDKRRLRQAVSERKEVEVLKCWKEIGNAATNLFDSGWYLHVATVTCDSASEAFRLTTSINAIWFLKNDKRVIVENTPSRSTAHFDVVKVNNQRYLYVLGGFYSLEAQRFVRDKDGY